MELHRPVDLAVAQTSAAADTAPAGAGFRRVLLCLDRSPAAEAGLPLAAWLAAQGGGRLTLVHVVRPPNPGSSRAVDALDWDILRQEARAYLEQLADRGAALGVATDHRLAEGSAPHHIAQLAQELGADLLVLSTTGEGGAGDWPLGSTTRKALALARSAVLVVPAGQREPGAAVPPRRILVPLDGSVRSECVLPTALRLGRAGDVELVLAHVVAEPVRTEVLSTEEDLALAHALSARLTQRAEAYLQRVRARLEGSGARVKAVVSRSTDHREGVVALAAAEQVDLVLLAAHGATCNPRGRYGSVTEWVMSHAPAPVLTIQDLTEAAPTSHAFQPPRLPERATDAGPAEA